MVKIYGDGISGNCYKLQLLMSYLKRDYEWIQVDIMKAESRTEDFRLKSPMGKVPVLELADGRVLGESNAILFYLASGTQYLPDDLWVRARILQWQNFERSVHEPSVAIARYINLYLGLPEKRRAEYESKAKAGRRVLRAMDEHLAENEFFVGGNLTIADITLYPYTHNAGEGGFDLSSYKHIQQWLAAVSAHPGYIPMKHAPDGLPLNQ